MSGHESRYDVAYQEQVKRIHDGAIGEVVAIQSMFLRPPYSTVSRDPQLSEIEYQFSNWYHFRWLSGDDVTQSLVHNLDRMRWVLHEENPTSCFGLAGRSTSFGEVYGDMFDHHTVVYEYAAARGSTRCARHAGMLPKLGRHHHGHQGHLPLDRLPHRGGDAVALRRSAQRLSRGGAEDPDRRDPRGPTRQRRRHHGRQHLHGHHGPNRLLHRQAGHVGANHAADFEFEPKLADVRLDGDRTTQPDQGNYPLPIPGLTEFL